LIKHSGFADEDDIPETPHYQEIYLTRESIEAQMPILWGLDQFKWLPTRFYFFLSGNRNLKRIYFGEYLDKIYKPLCLSEKKEK
jgi:hypothetical protein